MKTKTKKASLVGRDVWVLHEDTPVGYEVSVHETEAGAHAAALVFVEGMLDADLSWCEEDSALKVAVKAKDGRAALAAFEEIQKENEREAHGEVWLWITPQKVRI